MMKIMKKRRMTMSNIVKLAAISALVLSVAACDRLTQDRRGSGIESREYQTAMNDYRAGRIDQAVKGFKKTIALQPDNANARFQLACLLHDTGRDYLTAMCNYLEYVLQCPDSDKTDLAKDRLAKCEKDLAKSLADKHGLLDGGKAILKELEAAKEKLEALSAKVTQLESDLAVEKGRGEKLKSENERLVAAVKRIGEGETSTFKADKKAIVEARDLLDSEDDGDGDRIKNSADIALLRSEEASERELQSSLLPMQPKDAKEARDAAEKAERERREREKRQAIEKPEFYVVEEGDTLYKIALKFYGRTSQWRQIREANKAVISVDGRVKKGQKIRLP
jgi:tetratricopeptide (TPR) repeat protein